MPWCCRSTRRAMCGWPPACKRKVDGGERRACGHVSGLFARRTRPLATMDIRRLGPHQILGFEALDFFRLTQPVGTTDTSISLSLLQAFRCLIPEFDGALFSPAWKDALWARYCTGAPARQRRSVERYSIVKRA